MGEREHATHHLEGRDGLKSMKPAVERGVRVREGRGKAGMRIMMLRETSVGSQREVG